MRRCIAGAEDGGIILAGFADSHFVADLHLERRDIHLAPVDLDVAVAHDLARLTAAGAETHAVDHAVQAALQVGAIISRPSISYACG